MIYYICALIPGSRGVIYWTPLFIYLNFYEVTIHYYITIYYTSRELRYYLMDTIITSASFILVNWTQTIIFPTHTHTFSPYSCISYITNVKLRLTKKVLFHILSYFQPSYQLCLSNRRFKACFQPGAESGQRFSMEQSLLPLQLLWLPRQCLLLIIIFFTFYLFFLVYELPHRQRAPQRLCVREEGRQFRTRLYQQSKVCHLRPT